MPRSRFTHNDVRGGRDFFFDAFGVVSHPAFGMCRNFVHERKISKLTGWKVPRKNLPVYHDSVVHFHLDYADWLEERVGVRDILRDVWGGRNGSLDTRDTLNDIAAAEAAGVDDPLPFNLYSGQKSESAVQGARRWVSVNVSLKYRLLVPAARLYRLWLDKHYSAPLPDDKAPYNVTLNASIRAFESSKEIWTEQFLSATNARPRYMPKWYWKRIARLQSTKILDTAFKSWVHVVHNDTAFREFHNIYCLELQKEVAMAHAMKDGEGNYVKDASGALVPSGSAQHILCTVPGPAINTYYVMWSCLRRGKMSMYDGKMEPCCEVHATSYNGLSANELLKVLLLDIRSDENSARLGFDVE